MATKQPTLQCTKEECPGILEYSEVQKSPIVNCPDNPSKDVYFIDITPDFNWDCPLIRANSNDNFIIRPR